MSHPEKMALVVDELIETEHFVRHFRMTLHVMSVGPEGERWLDDNAPEWREHVGAVEFKVEHMVPHCDLMAAPVTFLKLTKNSMALAVARKLVEGMEQIEEVDHGWHWRYGDG